MRSVYKTDDYQLFVIDEPDPAGGGACHEYEVWAEGGSKPLLQIHFQRGPIGAHGVNGVQHDALLAAIRDRLDCFQRGPFASGVNEVTRGFVDAALASDSTRTRVRKADGVEGRNLP